MLFRQQIFSSNSKVTQNYATKYNSNKSYQLLSSKLQRWFLLYYQSKDESKKKQKQKQKKITLKPHAPQSSKSYGTG